MGFPDCLLRGRACSAEANRSVLAWCGSDAGDLRWLRVQGAVVLFAVAVVHMPGGMPWPRCTRKLLARSLGGLGINIHYCRQVYPARMCRTHLATRHSYRPRSPSSCHKHGMTMITPRRCTETRPLPPKLHRVPLLSRKVNFFRLHASVVRLRGILLAVFNSCRSPRGTRATENMGHSATDPP